MCLYSISIRKYVPHHDKNMLCNEHKHSQDAISRKSVFTAYRYVNFSPSYSVSKIQYARACYEHVHSRARARKQLRNRAQLIGWSADQLISGAGNFSRARALDDHWSATVTWLFAMGGSPVRPKSRIDINIDILSQKNLRATKRDLFES